MKVVCINGLVDGVTEGKEYEVLEIFWRYPKPIYGLIDDYGVYSEFNSERFKCIIKTGGTNMRLNEKKVKELLNEMNQELRSAYTSRDRDKRDRIINRAIGTTETLVRVIEWED